jgi:hypothetical protein
MPYPRWLAKINKGIFNPSEIRRGKRPHRLSHRREQLRIGLELVLVEVHGGALTGTESETARELRNFCKPRSKVVQVHQHIVAHSADSNV